MRKIQLTRGYVALVDDKDYKHLMKWKWTVFEVKPGRLYAGRLTRGAENKNGRPRRCVKMHREILQLTDPKIHVDHINHNTLDNRRSNIRACTLAENLRNRTPRGRSKYLGVSFWSNKWVALIRVEKRLLYLGRFKEEKEAALAYNKAAKRHFGQFANLNDVSY